MDKILFYTKENSQTNRYNMDLGNESDKTLEFRYRENMKFVEDNELILMYREQNNDAS
jgi:hypothetical protein